MSKREPSVVAIHVSDHARERARERFPGFKAARIVDEVRAAMKEGRFGPEKPEGMRGTSYSKCLYAWNDVRGYSLIAADNGLVVTTCVPRRGD